jgi:hypothetical protein
MNSKEYIQFVETELAKLVEVLRAKNSDYTGGSEDAFANFKVTEKLGLSDAETGLLIRMVDKIQRVRSFLVKGKLQVTNESVEDAVKDIIGYALLLLGMLREREAIKMEQAINNTKVVVSTNSSAFSSITNDRKSGAI